MDMDRSCLKHQYSGEFNRGVEYFLTIASNHLDKKGRTRCPSTKCKNDVFRQINVVKKHLYDNGMLKDYTRWYYHGEPEVLSDDEDDDDDDESNFGVNDGLLQMFDDIRSAADDRDLDVQHDVRGGNSSFYKILDEARQPLYPGCTKFTMLDFLVKLLHLKVINCSNIKAFNDNIWLIKKALPEGERLPNSYYEAKTLMRSLGLGYIPIYACKNDFSLFWKEHESLENCQVWNESRYKNSIAKGKKIPHKVLRYFPLKPRLQRLYISKMTAEDMGWHKEKCVQEENVFRHPADFEIWREFDEEYPWFANDPQNVRLGLATDGFNPFSDMSITYSMWPVMLMPYIMPPWKCMKDPFMFMSLLIPGPKAPGNDIDIFLRPLVDELNELWQYGVETFDVAKKETFQLHVVVLWTINDFPAYANLSGWSTKGNLACPVCNEDTSSMYLKNGRKLCCMNHMRFLTPRHPLKRRLREMFGHLSWSNTRPKDISEEYLLPQLQVVEQHKFEKNQTSKKRKRSTIERNWTKKSILFELPYWRTLKLRHNLYDMHIEKNSC